MSVVIKGMKLPKNCVLCPCCVGEGIGAGRQHYCQAIEDEPCVSETYRPKNCPLVEIRAPHGRLIDADELKKNMRNYYPSIDHLCCSQHVVTKRDIDCAPTIIEAEVSE